MRLAKIKLAGFKSFVDPTTIQFIGNLSSVVGPNGCGKSNVIDAVRWVMGESNAKHLRGGSITDVIFNGSSSRKPVGQATVELIFDNAEGKLGGEYAHYSEIAIKRQVSRDGQSIYFLNGQRCRRRDITDIFLGTGLGPRSYAIIEQGTISRIIEAKPDELRVFVEEAAGISKYKERRRETENRISHAQDNMSRLNDLRDELDKQLKHLQRQSQTAERFKQLKAQSQELGGQLAAMAWKRLDEEIQEHERLIRENSIALEAELAKLQSVKTQQEKQRIHHADMNDVLNEVQKRYYGVGNDIVKIEQSINRHQERDQQLRTDKQDAIDTLARVKAQWEQDAANLFNIDESLAECEPLLEQATLKAEQLLKEQQLAESALEEWRDKVSQLQQTMLVPSREAEAEKAKIAHLDRQVQQSMERQSRLEIAREQIQPASDTEIFELEEKVHEAINHLENIDNQLKDTLSQRAQVQEKVNALRPQIKTAQKSLNEAQGKQSALQTLQSVVLGKNAETRKAWLSEQGIGSPTFVAQKLSVTAGWETAVETVLEGFLEAISIEQGELSSLVRSIDSLKDSNIQLMEWQSGQRPACNDTERLLYYVKNADCLPESIYHLLNSVRVSGSTTEASQFLSNLAPEQSIITPEGHWLGQGWFKAKAPVKDQQAGILQREETLKQLAQEILVLQEQLENLQMALDESEETLKNIEYDRESQLQDRNRAHQAKVNLESERQIKQNRAEQNQKRQVQVEQEMAECQTIIAQAQQEASVARGQLQLALEKMSQCNQDQETMMIQKESLQNGLAQARINAKEAQLQSHDVALKLQANRTQKQGLTSNIERFKQQVEQAQTKINQLSEGLERNNEPLMPLKMELEEQLEKRIIIEDELNKTRDQVGSLDNELREMDRDLQRHESQINTLREQLAQVKMQWQALSVHRENTLEKLKNTAFTIEGLLETLPPEANEAIWQQQLADIEKQIERLGAINLAAIEEFDAAQERKVYLDAQLQDLTEALNTLEEAIRKIDRETRTKFKETFDKINAGFSHFFPRLFVGGQASASLVLTGEDLLETGVSVIARPPGKKNSTIAF